jgi:toxin-antitoxin system PIN domain toxin
MIAVDTNVLVAFHRLEYSHHAVAVEVVTSLAEGEKRWGIPWPCVHEFVAVVTNNRIFVEPTALLDAIAVLDALMESPVLRLLGEGPGYWDVARSLLLKSKVAGGRVHDARIAAICLEHRVDCLWTADRDFSRFPALKCRNPMAEAPHK